MIINITPVHNLPLLLGLDDEEDSDEKTSSTMNLSLGPIKEGERYTDIEEIMIMQGPKIFGPDRINIFIVFIIPHGSYLQGFLCLTHNATHAYDKR